MKKIFIFLSLLILIFPIFASHNLTISNGEKVEVKEDFILLSLDVSSAPIQSIQFSLSNQLLDKCNLTESEKIEFIDSLIEKVDMIRTEFLLNLTLKYIQNPISEFKINDGVILSSVVYDSEQSLVGFKIVYQSMAAFNYYNSSSKSTKPLNRGNIFIQKYTSTSLFPFCGEVNLGGGRTIMAGERYKNFFTSAASGQDYYQTLCQFYSPVYIYDYVVNGKLSSNAQYVAKDERGVHHVWLTSENELQSKPTISLSIAIINRAAWFLTALILAFCALLISIIIIYRFNIKKFLKKLIFKIKNK